MSFQFQIKRTKEIGERRKERECEVKVGKGS